MAPAVTLMVRFMTFLSSRTRRCFCSRPQAAVPVGTAQFQGRRKEEDSKNTVDGLDEMFADKESAGSKRRQGTYPLFRIGFKCH